MRPTNEARAIVSWVRIFASEYWLDYDNDDDDDDDDEQMMHDDDVDIGGMATVVVVVVWGDNGWSDALSDKLLSVKVKRIHIRNDIRNMRKQKHFRISNEV